MPAIRNGRGITAASISSGRQDAYQAGQPIGTGRDVTFSNPYLAQISTITIDETADGSAEVVEDQVWTVTLTDPDGNAYETAYTVTAADETAAGAGSDEEAFALAATRLATAIEANSELDNIVMASADAEVLTITWLHPNQGEWTVAIEFAPAVAEDVLTGAVATSQDAGGSTLPMARFVVCGSPVAEGPGGPGRRASLPTSIDDLIAGITLKDVTQVRPFDTSATAVNAYPIGSLPTVREYGMVAMTNVGGSAAVADGAVYAVISTAGGDALGEARTTRAGVAQITTATPTAVNDTTYRLLVSLPEFDGLPELSRTFEVLADGGTSATEICDAFRTAMAADTAFTAQVVASGTTTLVLTGQVAGRPFTVLDVQEGAGDWASITTGTPAVAYTKKVPGARWTRPTAANAIGPVFVITPAP